MIELGKYGTEFIVSESDVIAFTTVGIDRNSNGKSYSVSIDTSNIKTTPTTYDIVDYKGFKCYVKSVYTDTVGLILITNNPNDYIPIVV